MNKTLATITLFFVSFLLVPSAVEAKELSADEIVDFLVTFELATAEQAQAVHDYLTEVSSVITLVSEVETETDTETGELLGWTDGVKTITNERISADEAEIICQEAGTDGQAVWCYWNNSFLYSSSEPEATFTTLQDFRFNQEHETEVSFCASTSGEIEVLPNIRATLFPDEATSMPYSAQLQNEENQEIVSLEQDQIEAAGYQDSGLWGTGVKFAYDGLEADTAYTFTMTLNPDAYYLEQDFTNNTLTKSFSTNNLPVDGAVCYKG